MQNVATAPAFDDRLLLDRFHSANSSSPSPLRLQRLPLIARALIHTNVSKLSNGWQTTAGLSPPHTQPVPALFAPSTPHRFQPFHPLSKMPSVCLFRAQSTQNMNGILITASIGGCVILSNSQTGMSCMQT